MTIGDEDKDERSKRAVAKQTQDLTLGSRRAVTRPSYVVSPNDTGPARWRPSKHAKAKRKP
jgi:hypothetical protein